MGHLLQSRQNNGPNHSIKHLNNTQRTKIASTGLVLSSQAIQSVHAKVTLIEQASRNKIARQTKQATTPCQDSKSEPKSTRRKMLSTGAHVT